MNKFQINDVRRLTNLILLSKESSVPGRHQDRVGWLEKYFLIRLIHIFGVDVPITESTDILVPTLGVSYKNICHSLELLSTLGIVSMEKITNGRGRPVKAFQIQSDRLLEYFQVSTATGKDLVHQSMIDSLLCWGQRNEDACLDLGQGENTRSKRAYIREENHDLDGKARFFLAVLFAHADEFGFVGSIGQAYIESVTSFSPDQQRSLVGKLLTMGYIRSRIKGFTCSKIFGRVESSYCLNTSKSNIPGQPSLTFILFVSAEGRQAHEKSEAFQLYSLWCRIKSGNKSIPVDRVMLVRSLVDGNDCYINLNGFPPELFSIFGIGSIVDYLQFRLETYATWFLELPIFNGNQDDLPDSYQCEVLKRIRSDAFSEYPAEIDRECDKVKRVKGKLLSPDAIDSACKILYLIAFDMAMKYHQFLLRYGPNLLRGKERLLRVFPRLRTPQTFEHLSISFASFVAVKEAARSSQFEYLYVHDNRADIQKSLIDLSKNRFSFGVGKSDYDFRYREIEEQPKTLLIERVQENMIDDRILKKCGMNS